MKPEIYYDKKERDLVWNEMYLKLVGEVAALLREKGIYYDEAIIEGSLNRLRRKGFVNGIEYPYGYVAWTCLQPDPLLNHPRIKPLTVPPQEEVFKIGDRVVLRPEEELQFKDWKRQEVGVGIVENFHLSGKMWYVVEWEDGNHNDYRNKDLILKEAEEMETKERRVPTKEQVLATAKKCPQWKEGLKELFPEDFADEFDWKDFYNNPFKHITIESENRIRLSYKLRKAYEVEGRALDSSLYPRVSLSLLKALFTDMYNKLPEELK